MDVFTLSVVIIVNLWLFSVKNGLKLFGTLLLIFLKVNEAMLILIRSGNFNKFREENRGFV